MCVKVGQCVHLYVICICVCVCARARARARARGLMLQMDRHKPTDRRTDRQTLQGCNDDPPVKDIQSRIKSISILFYVVSYVHPAEV